MLTATEAHEQSNVFEPNILPDGAGGYIMYYTGGWGTPNICRATAPDLVNWTKYASNPIVANHCRSFVLQDGSTFYMYTAPTAQTTIDLYTSSDGISFTLDTAAAIAIGTAGQWDDHGIANSFVWKESANDWRMLYEAKRNGTAWHIGYATSTDGRVWTKSGSNPVIQDGGNNGGQGGPWVTKVGSTYYLWYHRSLGGTNSLPTDIYRMTSPDLVNWTNAPNFPLLPRITADEGAGTTVGQCADPFGLVVGSQFYLFYAASADGGNITGAQRVKLAIADLAAMTESAES